MEDLELLFGVYALYLWLGLVALVLALALWLFTLHSRIGRALHQYERLVDGVQGANLEDALERQISLLEETQARIDALEALAQELDQGLRRAVQKVGVTRFNPFVDTGGDQSFCIALLDSLDDGVVLSSLFSRSETRVFAKPIQRGRSKYVLTDEELRAIELANEPRTPPRAK